jgi:NADH dehydrogenase (ubiquinone) Fe-S protein 1
VFGLKFQQLGWDQVLKHTAIWDKRYNNCSFLPIIGGNSLDLEAYDNINVLFNKNYLNQLTKYSFRANLYSNYADFTQNFLFNSEIAGLEESDLCLLVGTNPRFEASVLNARLRKLVSKGTLKVAFIGSGHDSQNLTYNVLHLGSSGMTLKLLLQGEHWFCSHISQAKNVVIIYGYNSLREKSFEDSYRLLSEYLLSNVRSIRQKNINVLHTTMSDCNRLFIGLDFNSSLLYESYSFLNSNMNQGQFGCGSIGFFGRNGVEHFIFKDNNLIWSCIDQSSSSTKVSIMSQ